MGRRAPTGIRGSSRCASTPPYRGRRRSPRGARPGRRHRLLPRRRRRGPRGRGRAGARGIIEPGHFRFQCHGEDVLHLEISLGYQHRGVERALAGGPTPRTDPLHGDRSPATPTIGARDSPTARPSRRSPDAASPPRAAGAARRSRSSWSGSPTTPATSARWPATSASCPTAVLLRPAPRRLPEPDRAALRQPLRPRPGPARRRRASTWTPSARRELLRAARRRRCATCRGAVELLLGHAVGAWPASRAPARSRASRRGELGLVGVAARACGRRARRPPRLPVRRSTASRRSPCRPGDTGDVFARAYVRWLEIQRSLAFVREQLDGPARRRRSACRCRRRSRPTQLVVSLVEGWRGEICHVALTDARRPLRALQGGRPVVPQLVRPGPGAARPADLRFSAVQQELQPVVLRPRPVSGVDADRSLTRSRLAAGPPHDRRIPAQAAGAARPLPRACPRIDAAAMRRPDCRALRATPARRAPSRRRTPARARPRPLPLLHRLRRGLPGGRDPLHRATTAWPTRDARRTWCSAGERAARSPRRSTRETRRLFGRSLQAAPGERRRLQRLRGRRQRARAPSSSTSAASASSSSPRRATPTACWSPAR